MRFDDFMREELLKLRRELEERKRMGLPYREMSEEEMMKIAKRRAEQRFYEEKKKIFQLLENKEDYNDARLLYFLIFSSLANEREKIEAREWVKRHSYLWKEEPTPSLLSLDAYVEKLGEKVDTMITQIF